jgi:hypothetical protein
MLTFSQHIKKLYVRFTIPDNYTRMTIILHITKKEEFPYI